MSSRTTRGVARRCAKCGRPLAADNTAAQCARCHRDQRDQLASPPCFGPDFFATDDFRAAFDSHHIGRVFKVYRHHPFHLKGSGKALNQELLGRWLGINQAQVSRIENGPPEYNIKVLQHYAKVLHLSPSRLWFAMPGQSLIRENGIYSTRNLGDNVVLSGEESAKFLAWADNGNIGDLAIDQLHGEIRHVARNYLQSPAGPLFERLLSLRNQVFELIGGHQKISQTRDLYSAAGWSLTSLAWMATDLGFLSAADEHLRAAWLCAENADQNSLRAWVRATQHTAARWRSDFSSAAKYVQDGLRYTGGGSAELFLSSALALDKARLGDRDGGREALTRAKRAAEILNTAQDELTGPFTCSVERAGSFWSDVHIALKSPGEALAVANHSIEIFETTPSDLRNLGSERMVRCRQVQAQIELGELEGARDAFLPILSTPSEFRLKPLMNFVESIAISARKSKHREDPLILEILEAASEFRHGSARD